MENPSQIKSGEASASEKGAFSFFNLAKGYIQYNKESPQALNPKESKNSQRVADYFLFCKHYKVAPIRLYRKQMLEFVQELPKAFDAVVNGHSGYCWVVFNNKTNRITLEVNEYDGQYFLFLKKSFKPEDKAEDPNQDWIYTKSNVQLDPRLDNVYALEEFVLSCCQ